MSNRIVFDAADHDPNEVTVFQVNRADVARRVDVELKKGQNEVEIRSLPSLLDQSSIRVDGIGKAIILDVIYKPLPPQKQVTFDNEDDSVKNLIKNKASIDARLGMFTRQNTILQEYANSVTSQHTSADQLAEFLDTFDVRKAAIIDSIASVKNELLAVNRKIDAARKDLRKDYASHLRGATVVVVVHAEGDGPAHLTLTYGITNASWTPFYDLRAAVDKPTSTEGASDSTVTLAYRASIFQSTGEDWTNVKLTLSTASPQIGSVIPQLRACRLSASTSSPVADLRKVEKSGQTVDFAIADEYEESDDDMGFGLFDDFIETPAENPKPLARMAPLTVVAPVEQGEGFNATFTIEGLSSIPSDTPESSERHRVTIAEVDLEDVLMEWIAVPKLISSVFLQCRVKNTSPFIFLPGDSNVYMNDKFVSKSRIPHVSPQESFSCSLGVDPSVRVTYHQQHKKTSAPTGGFWSARTVTTSHSQKITVKNTRRTMLSRLIIRDQVPLSADARIKVQVIEPPFTDRNATISSIKSAGTKSVSIPSIRGGTVVARWAPAGDDSDSHPGVEVQPNEEGFIEWVCRVDASASIDLSLSWDVNVPKGLRLPANAVQ